MSYIVRILKRSRKENYENTIVVDKGIVKNSFDLKRAKRKQWRTAFLAPK